MRAQLLRIPTVHMWSDVLSTSLSSYGAAWTRLNGHTPSPSHPQPPGSLGVVPDLSSVPTSLQSPFNELNRSRSFASWQGQVVWETFCKAHWQVRYHSDSAVFNLGFLHLQAWGSGAACVPRLHDL